MEKTLWRKIFDRFIKLYTPDGLYPNGAKHFIPGAHWETHTQNPVDFVYKGALRDYQLEAVMHVYENEWWLIEAGTWSGKSHMIISIAQLYKKRTLIVTPSKKLVKEMYDKFIEFTDYVPWLYYSDKKDIKDITITTHKSFVEDSEGDKLLADFDIIVVDECDTMLSSKMIHAICRSDCWVLIWLTGTPDRQELHLEDMELVFWPHTKVGTYQQLPDEINHYVYRWSPSECETIDYTNWHYQRESILNNLIRLESVSILIKENLKQSFLTLLLLDRHEEIEKYRLIFPDAIVITWKTKVKDDEVGIEKIRKSWWLIIGSIKKMYRWVDIPEIDNVIIASPIRFEANVIQSIWRALRPHPDKTKIRIGIINDDVLNNQRREQSKACLKQYKSLPNIIYFDRNGLCPKKS